jgi:hypothetical protein
MKIEAMSHGVFVAVLSISSCLHEVVGASASARSKAKTHSKKRYEEYWDYQRSNPQMQPMPMQMQPMQTQMQPMQTQMQPMLTQMQPMQTQMQPSVYTADMQLPESPEQPPRLPMQVSAEGPMSAQTQYVDRQAQQSGHGASFLAQGAAQGETAALVARLSDAVAAQSKAMVLLENEVERVAAQEATFEKQEQEMWDSMEAKPACADYKKNNVGPVTDKGTCESACRTGEGLYGGSYKGSGSGSSCSCRVKPNKYNAYRDICGNGFTSGISLLVTLSIFMMTFRLE